MSPAGQGESKGKKKKKRESDMPKARKIQGPREALREKIRRRGCIATQKKSEERRARAT